MPHASDLLRQETDDDILALVRDEPCLRTRLAVTRELRADRRITRLIHDARMRHGDRAASRCEIDRLTHSLRHVLPPCAERTAIEAQLREGISTSQARPAIAHYVAPSPYGR